MAFEWDTLPGNTGVRPRTREVYLTAHGTITEGIIYSLDTTTATAAAYGVATDSAAAVDGATEGTIWVVALESGTSGQRLKFALRGWVTVTADGTGVSAGDPVSSDANGDITVAPAGDIIIGVAPEAIALNATGKIWFDGTGISAKHA